MKLAGKFRVTLPHHQTQCRIHSVSCAGVFNVAVIACNYQQHVIGQFAQQASEEFIHPLECAYRSSVVAAVSNNVRRVMREQR